MVYFSEEHSDTVYDIDKRRQKARKIIAVLDDYYSGSLKNLCLLDVGCSTGIISSALSERFAMVTGIDVDNPAIDHARHNYTSSNLQFKVGNGVNLGFDNNSFDVVVCSHIYEHAPDSAKLLSEIERVLKPGGVCYFACGNRISLMEPHYKLPLLSLMPKIFANTYRRILGRGKIYRENHMTLWGLKRLISGFYLIDYTIKIIRNPDKYCATEVVKQGSFKQKIAVCVAKVAYFILPGYIWLLHKKERSRR